MKKFAVWTDRRGSPNSYLDEFYMFLTNVDLD